MTESPRPRVAKRIWVYVADSKLKIEVNDRVVVVARTVPELIEAAHISQDQDPFVLDKAASVRLDLERAQRAALLPEFTPAKVLQEQLYDAWESAGEPSAFDLDDAPPIETGVTVDGQPWGWLYVVSDDVWQLIPTTPSDVIFDLTVSFDGATMTSGMVFDAGVRRWPSDHGMSWYENPDNGDHDFSVLYEVDDWEGPVLEAITFDSWPWCPMNNHPSTPDFDEEQYADAEDEGWTAHLDLDDSIFSEEFIGSALQQIWVPCKVHVGENLTLNEVGRSWSWTGSTWIPKSDLSTAQKA